MNPEKNTYYIYRHGETIETSRNQSYYGLNFFLTSITDNGRHSASELGSLLSKTTFETHISSPFKRCRQTSEIVASKLDADKVLYSILLCDSLFLEIPWLLRQRLKSLIRMIEKKYSGNVLICTHQAPMVVLVELLTDSRSNLIHRDFQTTELVVIKQGKLAGV